MFRGPLVLVDDDSDDQEIIAHALGELGFTHMLKTFRDAQSALDYLHESDEKPFLIVSDINMPKMDGLRFKEAIESSETLKGMNIPFVFLSTASSTSYISRAYELKAQGFFEKGSTYADLKTSLETILSYWERSKQAN